MRDFILPEDAPRNPALNSLLSLIELIALNRNALRAPPPDETAPGPSPLDSAEEELLQLKVWREGGQGALLVGGRAGGGLLLCVVCGEAMLEPGPLALAENELLQLKVRREGRGGPPYVGMRGGESQWRESLSEGPPKSSPGSPIS